MIGSGSIGDLSKDLKSWCFLVSKNHWYFETSLTKSPVNSLIPFFLQEIIKFFKMMKTYHDEAREYLSDTGSHHNGFKLSGDQDGDLCAVKIGQLFGDPAGNTDWSCWNFKSGWVRVAYSCLFAYYPEKRSSKTFSNPHQFNKIKILMRFDHSTVFPCPHAFQVNETHRARSHPRCYLTVPGGDGRCFLSGWHHILSASFSRWSWSYFCRSICGFSMELSVHYVHRLRISF